jgi:hypothetical protein
MLSVCLYIMAPEPISTAYLKNCSHHSVSLMCILVSLLDNGSVITAVTVTHQTRRVLCYPCRIKGKWPIISSQNILFYFEEPVIRYRFYVNTVRCDQRISHLRHICNK